MLNHIPPITRNIIILNVILFVITEFLFPSLKWDLSAYIPTSPHFQSWQVITHMFMHNGFMHLAFNMFTLWSFGSVLERTLGEKKFIILYFLSGLGAFILFNLWNYYQVYELHKILAESDVDIREIYRNTARYGIQPIFGETQTAYALRIFLSSPMLGASGAVFGVMAGFCTIYPNSKMFIMFIPFPIKAKYLLPIVILISAFLGIRSFSWDNVAHFAHIGGALIGWGLVHSWKKQ
ncbi:MAG: rhomboid family intramembrane serine protease [Flavobacteriaceae bacterium]|nr:rhomboid family intramembrane serine protease [Flavobacteriaceae bacterium]